MNGDPERPLAGKVALVRAASGTNTSSSTTVCEPVARSPNVSHVFSMDTPLAAMQHAGSVWGVVPTDARYEHVADLAAAGG
jgi:hypothetical protein